MCVHMCSDMYPFRVKLSKLCKYLPTTRARMYALHNYSSAVCEHHLYILSKASSVVLGSITLVYKLFCEDEYQ
jgi:hypothetical protein